MFNITSGLRRLRKAGQAGGGYDSNPQSFSFNGTNGYIQQVGYSGGVVRKQNDGSRDYWQCYGGYFNIGDSAVHGLDNRSVQTMKFVGQLDNILNIQALASYTANGGADIFTSGAVRVYLPGTGSITISSTTTITPGAIYNVIVRINNTLPSGTARVIGDADIFISGTKSGVTSATQANNTSTNSTLLRGGATTTTQPTYGRLYNFSLWNRALSDAECQAEGASNRSVVTPSGLVNTWDTTDTSQAISRTGYNLNVAGNVSVGTDGDGKFILSNGNRNGTAATGTWTTISNTTINIFTEKTDFTYETEFKLVSNAPNNNTGIIGSGAGGANGFVTSIYATASGVIRFGIRVGGTNYEFNGPTLTLGQKYVAELKYKASEAKLYGYLDGTLLNSGGTSVTGAFTFSGFGLGDVMILGGTTSSSTKKYYRATLWSRYLSDADSTAHRNLGNNINNDPTIVASYRPDNLINQQFLTFNSDYTNAVWSKNGTTVTADFSTAPDGTNTADRLTITGALHNGIFQTSTTLTGSSLASKTFIVKCFAKVASGTGTFRLRMDHAGVDTNQYSTDQTATTTWQEFTFTRTFTSSTAGTGITASVTAGSAGAAVTLEVRNVRVFLVNEILYDNSPNIGGYVGPLVNRYIGGWIRPGVDALNDSSGNPILNLGYGYAYIRNTDNAIRIRYDDRIGAKESSRVLGTGFRGWVYFIGGIERDGVVPSLVTYINGSKVLANQFLDMGLIINPQVQILLGRMSTRYFTGSMRDMRIFTSPTALTDAQALMITNGGDPMDVTKVLHRDALPSDTTNYVTDKSGNGRVGYITGGVTKTF